MAKDWLCSQPGCGMHHSDHVAKRKREIAYVKFEEVWSATTRKTKLYRVSNQEGIPLGGISFSGAWRKYVFHPEADTQFDAKCLEDIVNFLKERTQVWRDSL